MWGAAAWSSTAATQPCSSQACELGLQPLYPPVFSLHLIENSVCRSLARSLARSCFSVSRRISSLRCGVSAVDVCHQQQRAQLRTVPPRRIISQRPIAGITQLSGRKDLGLPYVVDCLIGVIWSVFLTLKLTGMQVQAYVHVWHPLGGGEQHLRPQHDYRCPS